MRSIAVLVSMCAALAAVTAAPTPVPQPDPAAAAAAAAADDNTPEIIEIIAPARSAQETLSTLNLGTPGSDLSDRNKRTIGILRQLFPQLTQIIEQKVQQITSMVLQTFGPVVLRAFLGNRGGAGGNKGGGGGTVELDDDDDDDDEDEEADSPKLATTEPPAAATTTEEEDAIRRRRRALYWNVAADENQLLSGAESQQAEVRVAFGENQAQAEPQAAASEDQQTAAQTNSASIDEISLEDSDASDENRNKRFLNFGGSGGAGGGGGGSGNFLFDIVRLVAGSSSGSSGGDAGATDGEGDDASAGKGDNLTEGVPGPITRLFIIANRGIANLIQDLILRLAQTSERIVNFKARLITSII